jgi:hypothetical protein
MFNGVFVYINREERERLANLFNGWLTTPTRIVTFRLPHEGQIQFVLMEPETCDGAESAKVAPGIVSQISDGETDAAYDKAAVIDYIKKLEAVAEAAETIARKFYSQPRPGEMTELFIDLCVALKGLEDFQKGKK